MSEHMTYVTVDDGIDFRTISKIMSENGENMNHATARNILLSGLRKIAYQILISYNVPTTSENLDTMIKSQQFQDGIADLLFL
jgi:hypothetical protein